MNDISANLIEATTPNEAVIFEGDTEDFVSISGEPYYVRITKRCLSPSFDMPFISLYFQCDEAETYECQLYIMMDDVNTVMLDSDWTEASDAELNHILEYVDSNKKLWIESAESSPLYVSLPPITSNLQYI